jgi:CheY-like chemotaxis protein
MESKMASHEIPLAKILVVDDERVIASTLRQILEQQGYRVTAAFDGDMAVEVAQSFRPDVLLTDVHMPKMNGVEAAIQITSELPTCSVLLLTGSYDLAAESLAKAKARGYDFPVIDKPIAPDELVKSIRTTIAKRAPAAIPLC